MRYLTFSAPGESAPRLGVLDGDLVVSLPGTLLDLIRAGGLKASGYQRQGTDPGPRYAANEIRWHAPIPRPSKNVFCVGRNYLTHIEEGARARGVEVHAVTLHVGPATFRPVTAPTVEAHTLPPERASVSPATAAAPNGS